jgi:hypothetical protein
MIGRTAALSIVVALALACGHSSPAPTSKGGHLGSLGTAGCQPAAAFHVVGSNGGLPEAGMDTTRGSIWALAFSRMPPPAGQEIKVVWRMTGAGAFAFRVSDATGQVISLVWGPEDHGSSTWKHPGDEVGTGFKFPHSGCWQIHVTRPNVDADLWLGVAAA